MRPISNSAAPPVGTTISIFCVPRLLRCAMLVNHAQARLAKQAWCGRGACIPATAAPDISGDTSDAMIVSLHDALEILAREAPRLAQVVECRYFGGFDEAATAKAPQSLGTHGTPRLGVSSSLAQSGARSGNEHLNARPFTSSCELGLSQGLGISATIVLPRPTCDRSGKMIASATSAQLAV